MKFSFSWLKEHIDLKTEVSLSDIIDALTCLGLEVEKFDDPFNARRACVEQKREKEKNDASSSAKKKTLKVAKRTPLSPQYLSDSCSDDGSVIKGHSGVVSFETPSPYSSDEEGIPVERVREILEEVQRKAHKDAWQALRATLFKEGVDEVTLRKISDEANKNLSVDVSRYLEPPPQKKRRAATTDGLCEWCSPTE